MDLTRIDNDHDGGPRYVVHFLSVCNNKDDEEASRLAASYGLTGSYKAGSKINFLYEIALKKAKEIGGRKYNNTSYGGGIVFRSVYNTEDLIKKIKSIL